jgi:Zn ribbon nucleic-acid-binding protein
MNFERMPDSLLNRACPLCEEPKSHLLFHKDTLQLVRCASCSMVYANRRALGEQYQRRAGSGQVH